ncbi:MAG: hypothetical protein SOI52_05560 [Erysipelotrichaceae bacterium]
MRIRCCIRQRVCAREYGIAISNSGRLPAARYCRYIFCGAAGAVYRGWDLSKTLCRAADAENVSY